MAKIKEFDKEFFKNIAFDIEGLNFYDITEEPFKIHGLIRPENENDTFRRMPREIAEKVSEGVKRIHTNTAGGRVRFKTNSSRIAIFAKMPTICKWPHFALTGSAGFDVYVNNKYFKTFIPPYDMKDGYSGVVNTKNNDEKEIHINFPLYSDVSSLVIGLDEGASVSAPSLYKHEKPVVYYGSSITQGGFASRSGIAYEEAISRRLDCDYINLGFASNAKGEREMAEYIRSLDMSAFVYDYDANADDAEYLQKTHKRMFDIIRERNPELPIIMLTFPNASLSEDYEKRRVVIKNTYLDALNSGDKNVYFIDGCEMMREASDDNSTTVDDIHPNDYGFVVMAKKIGDTLEKALASIWHNAD